MAENDVPNRHGRKPPNGQDDAFEAIERIGRRASTRSAEERANRQRLARAAESLEGLEQLIEREPNALEVPSVARALKEDRAARNRLGPALRLRTEARRERAVDETYNAIQREFSKRSINGSVGEAIEGEGIQNRAMGLAGSSPRELQAGRRGIMAGLGELEKSSLNIAQNSLYNREGQQDPAALAELRANYRKRSLLVGQLSTIEAAERNKRAAGEDIESQNRSLAKLGRNAKNVLWSQGISDELASGQGLGGMSGADLKRREAEEAQRLLLALEKLRNSADQSAETIDKLKEEAGAAGDNLKRTQEAMRQGGGQGGGGTNWLAVASSGFGAAAAGVQQIGVNQRLAQQQNIAGYAGWENQKYAAYKAAAGGDIAALMSLGNFGGAEGFGNGLKTAANIAVGLQGAGGIAQTAMGAAQVGAGGNLLADLANTGGQVNTVGAGIQNIVAGGATTAVAGFDLFRGVSGRQSDIAGRHAAFAAAQQVQAISAEQLQGFRDFTTGLSGAATSMGANGENFLKSSITSKNLEDMVSARISPEEFSKLAQAGAVNTGSVFDASQIFAARGLERSGFGTMQETAGRFQTLAAAGANNPRESLAATLESAFTKGLNSSKAITDLVQNTAQMAQSSTGRMAGLDVTAASARLITSAVDKNDPNKEFAVQRAANIADLARGIGTNTGMNYAGMVATSRIRASTGLGGVESILAQGLDDATLQTLRTKSSKEAVDFLRTKGIGATEQNVHGMVGSLIKDRQLTLLEAGGKGFAIGGDRTAILNKLNNGGYESLTGTEQLKLNQAAGLAGAASGRDYANYIRGLGQGAPTALTAADRALAGKAGGELQTALQDTTTLGSKQLATAASQAAIELGGASQGVHKLIDAFKELEKHVSGATERSFSSAAANAAGSGGKGMDVGTFNDASSRMLRAANALLVIAGSSAAPDNVQKKKVPGTQ